MAEGPSAGVEFRSAASWLKLSGRWEITPEKIRYSPDLEDDPIQSMGIVLCDLRMDEGSARVYITLDAPNEHACGRMLFRGRGADSYYAAGLGGWGHAYTISRYTASGWQILASLGSYRILDPLPYDVKVTVEARQITMHVQGQQILACGLSEPLEGRSLGLMAWRSAVTFSSFGATTPRPKAFVAIEYSDALDRLFNAVIFEEATNAGFECRRAKDIRRPGTIIGDIHDDIVAAGVVIAEVSRPNPNVYYEIGFALAKGREVIFLAKDGTHLPFNVQERRCIMYTGTEEGHDKLRAELRRHLHSVRQHLTW